MSKRFAGWNKISAIKRHKFGAQKATVNGEMLDSRLEGRHYAKLLLLQKAGEVMEIKRQVPFVVTAEPKELSVKYVADFVVTFKDGREEIQDCKGYETREYKRKKRLLKKFLNIEIVEIKR